MKAKVVFSADFDADVASQTRYLVTQDRADWAGRLFGDIEAVAELLAAHPEAGASESHRLRRLVLPTLPFIVWYRWNKRDRKVVVLRLFHVRQASSRRR